MTADLPDRGQGTHAEPERKPSRGNPLRRTSDRVQRWVGALVVVLSLAAVPAAATGVGQAVHRVEMAKVRASAGSYAVEAHLVSDAGVRKAAARGDENVTTPVRWTERDGAVRTALVRVDVETSVLSPVPLWVSPGGVVSTVPPQTASEAAVAGWLTAIVTSALVTGIVYVSWKGFVHLMNRRRYAQWAREWDEVEPRMSGRTRDM
jgi:hypothetical protein